MWSYYQYRRISKEIEGRKNDNLRTRKAISSGDHDAEKANPTPAPSNGLSSAQIKREANEDDKTSKPEESTSGKSDENVEKKSDETTEKKSEDKSEGNGRRNSEEQTSDDQILVQTTSDEEDPFDPRNWPLAERSKNVAIICLLIFVQAWAGGAESMANTSVSQEFGVSKTVENLSTAMYLFGIGSGCLFVGAISDAVGRNPVYFVGCFCYLLFVAGSALAKGLAAQIICRYFIGLCSSATLGINGASVKDQFRPVKRAFVFPLIAWANVVPPVLAPMVGGWVSSHPDLSWRWMDWITLIISGFGFLVAFLFLPETNLAILLDWKAQHLRRTTGDKRYISKHAEDASLVEKIKQALPMPAKLFLKEPVVTVLGSYLILLYVLLFSFLSGFDYIFKETYKLTSGQTGSCFGAIAAGATLFTVTAPAWFSWARHHTEHIQGAAVNPEFRLWPAVIMSPFLPISLFWLGWTNDPSISIWSGLAACFLFGIVLIAMYVSTYEYIIDSYGETASLALASITMVRYLIAGSMAMAARPMYEGIGVKWTMTFLGCLGVLVAPGPVLLWKYGGKLRKKSTYAKDSI